MLALWRKLKQEFIKTFMRGNEIRSSDFITWRTHDPSRIEIWWSRIRPKVEKNAVIIQTIAAIFGMIGVILTAYSLFR